MIAFVIGIIATIVAFIVLGIDFSEYDFVWGLKKRQVFSLLGLIICLLGFIKTVPTGSTGIVTTFGRIENITLDAGIHFMVPWKKVVNMDNRTQKQSIEMQCFSSDIQEVSVIYTVNYQINKANAQEIYRTIGKEYFDKTNTLDPLDDVNINIDDPDIGEFPEGTTFDGATLSLKSKTTLSLYLTSDVEGLTFTCIEKSADGQPVREMTVENVKTETGYIARIRDIAASELKNNFTLTVKNGETVLGTITYSPMNYCYKALNGGTTDERLINAVKALVAYADAAKAYFG